MANDLKIGLTFSGGGYRAAMFDLGTLSFLNYVKMKDGDTLLSHVAALTSVSGGTIPAMKYMLSQAKGQPVEKMVKELYEFLCNEDLMGEALSQMNAERANRDSSSIKIMAGIYDSRLFNNATMGDIIDNFDKIPVEDYTALATDFDNSLPFRFRVTSTRSAQTASGASRETYGVFGNQKHSISRSVVRYITPGEAMACSSCFPSGFEPMMYPNDFKVSQRDDLKDKLSSPFGIMDGGLTDNQGIEPVLLAEQRMRKYRDDKDRTDKALDLIIISDVASPYMEGYAPSKQAMPKWMGKLTMGRLHNYGLIAELVALLLFGLALTLGNSFWLGVMTVILAIVTALNVTGKWLKGKLFKTITNTFVGNRANFISHLKFASIEAMLMNRAKSLIMMSSEVFLKRMRQLNYGSVYKDKEWFNRLVSTIVYELREGENWEKRKNNGTLPDGLEPSKKIQDNTALAASMGTTLWFTDEHKAAGMPEALLADGQYTMCYNLLMYIDGIKKDQTNLNASHQLIIDCEQTIMEAWKRFQDDPLWLVKQITGKA